MAMSSDEELRLKCLELALQGNPRGVLTRARTYYKFAKGDRKEEDEEARKIAPPYVQSEQAKRIAGMVRPT